MEINYLFIFNTSRGSFSIYAMWFLLAEGVAINLLGQMKSVAQSDFHFCSKAIILKHRLSQGKLFMHFSDCLFILIYRTIKR